VQLSHDSHYKGKRKLASRDNSGTTDFGEYCLFGLSSGKYFLRATPNESPGLTDRQGYAPTYYPPGTSVPAGATALELQPGTVLRGVEITLMKTCTVRLPGRVVDLAGTANGGVYVIVDAARRFATHV